MFQLSIITVVLNDKDGIRKTIESVINQKKIHNNIEYIVIDGKSEDGTLDVIKNYSNHIDYFISEVDYGIYDAMNKGIRLCSGDALLFLNAGDFFVGNVLEYVEDFPCFLKVKYQNLFGNLIDRPLFKVTSGIPNCHQGIIFENKNIYYNTSYSYCADYDFYIRHGYGSILKFVHSDGYILFDHSGISSKRIKERDRESFSIRRKHFGKLCAINGEVPRFFKRSLRLLLNML